MVKFKNFMFNVIAILFHIGIIYLLYLSVDAILTDSKDNFRINWALGIFSGFIIGVVLIGGRYFLRFLDKEIYDQNNIVTFLGYIYYCTELKNRKWVYHSDLGYYLCIITADRVKIFEPKFFYMKEIHDSYNNGDVDRISSSIKKSLDSEYSDILHKMKVDKEDKEKIKKIKSWDGYLDKQGRRDNKIDKILNQ